MTALLVSFLVLLAACEGDGPGNQDTLFSGFSLFVIIVLVTWLVFRSIKRRDRS